MCTMITEVPLSSNRSCSGNRGIQLHTWMGLCNINPVELSTRYQCCSLHSLTSSIVSPLSPFTMGQAETWRVNLLKYGRRYQQIQWQFLCLILLDIWFILWHFRVPSPKRAIISSVNEVEPMLWSTLKPVKSPAAGLSPSALQPPQTPPFYGTWYRTVITERVCALDGSVGHQTWTQPCSTVLKRGRIEQLKNII